MKRYRVLKDCTGFKTLNSPRTKWFKDELIYIQDNENPPADCFVRVPNPIDVLAHPMGDAVSYHHLQQNQKELAEPKSGFASNIDEIEAKLPKGKRKS